MQAETIRAELMRTAGQLEEVQAAEIAAAKEEQQAVHLVLMAQQARGRAAQLVSNAAMCAAAATGADCELNQFNLIQAKLKVTSC
jgi:hypothetical protein